MNQEINIEEAQITKALESVYDPELGGNIVELGMVEKIDIADRLITITIALTIGGCPLKSQIKKSIESKIAPLEDDLETKILWEVMTEEQKAATMDKSRKIRSEMPFETTIAHTTKIIAIASGKGGVGKSSVTTNLAVALAYQGHNVGVIDADIWGYSVPEMLNVEGRMEAENIDGKAMMKPASTNIGEGRLDVISMGMLASNPDDALMWRGLMLNRGLQHFIQDVTWSDDLQYLLVDLPPGTGDIALGLAQMLPRTQMLIVTTPAKGASQVAMRAVSMAKKSYIEVLGIVENMSYYLDELEIKHNIFGEGGGEKLAAKAGVELIAQIPIMPEVAQLKPEELKDSETGEHFANLAAKLVELSPPIEIESCSARLLEAIEETLS